MSYETLIFSNLFIGILMGMINAWSKKVFFMLMVGLILVYLWLTAWMSVAEIARDPFDWLRFVIGLVSMMVGMWIGKIAYEVAFE